MDLGGVADGALVNLGQGDLVRGVGAVALDVLEKGPEAVALLSLVTDSPVLLTGHRRERS